MVERQEAAAGQADNDDANIDEIDQELEDVWAEDPINQPRQMPINAVGGEEPMPDNAEEEQKDKARNANEPQRYFSTDEVKSRFLEALPPERRQLLIVRM